MHKVSIIIPTYNGAEYLQEALDSILSQSYKDFEVVFSDDASKDETLDIINRFKNKVDFPVRIFHHEPNGIGANWNHAMKQAQGEYIKFLFQDDVLMPDCLEKMVEVLEQQKKVGLVGCKRKFIINLDRINEEQQKWFSKYENLQKQFKVDKNAKYYLLTKGIFKSIDFKQSPMNKIGEPSVVMFRKSIIKKVGYFDENLKQILDYEYWYRILKKKHVVILNEPLVKFRVHNNQETQKNKTKKINDYQFYNYILYKNYFWLLNYKYQKEFFFRYNNFGKLIKKIKRAL